MTTTEIDYDPLWGSGPKCPKPCRFCGKPIWFASYLRRTLCMESHPDTTERAGYWLVHHPDDERISDIGGYASRQRRVNEPDLVVYRAHGCTRRRRRNPSGPMLLGVCLAIEEFARER